MSGRKILVDERLELLAVLRARREPRRDVRLPAEVGLGDVDDASARDGRGRRVAQVLDLEVERHVRPEHGDAVVVGEREQLVVVHHGVHVLDPDGVDGAVEDEPREVLLVLVARAKAARRCRRSTRQRATSIVQHLARAGWPRAGLRSARTLGVERRTFAAARTAGAARRHDDRLEGLLQARSTILDLPVPDGPTSMSEWRTRHIS